jgi:hypothetical protein
VEPHPRRSRRNTPMRCEGRAANCLCMPRHRTGPMKDSRPHRGLRHRRRDPLRRGESERFARHFGATRTGHLHEAARTRTTRPLRLLTRQSGKARPRVLLAPRARALLASQRAAPQSVPDPAMLIGDQADGQPPPDGREGTPLKRNPVGVPRRCEIPPVSADNEATV